MPNLESIARMIITLGLIILAVGGGMLLLSKLGLSTFRLPGDIVIRRGNFTLYFPLVSGLVLSLLLTIILNLFFRR